MTSLIQSDRTFATPHQQALAILAQLMIPADGELPAASDDVIFSDLLAELSRDSGVVVIGLESLESIPPEPHVDIVNRLRESAPGFLRFFETCVVTCYYRDPRVQRSLGMPGRAPFPGGYFIEPSNWSLLDPVRQRPPFYRDV